MSDRIQAELFPPGASSSGFEGRCVFLGRETSGRWSHPRQTELSDIPSSHIEAIGSRSLKGRGDFGRRSITRSVKSSNPHTKYDPSGLIHEHNELSLLLDVKPDALKRTDYQSGLYLVQIMLLTPRSNKLELNKFISSVQHHRCKKKGRKAITIRGAQ